MRDLHLIKWSLAGMIRFEDSCLPQFDKTYEIIFTDGYVELVYKRKNNFITFKVPVGIKYGKPYLSNELKKEIQERTITYYYKYVNCLKRDEYLDYRNKYLQNKNNKVAILRDSKKLKVYANYEISEKEFLDIRRERVKIKDFLKENICEVCGSRNLITEFNGHNLCNKHSIQVEFKEYHSLDDLIKENVDLKCCYCNEDILKTDLYMKQDKEAKENIAPPIFTIFHNTDPLDKDLYYCDQCKRKFNDKIVENIVKRSEICKCKECNGKGYTRNYYVEKEFCEKCNGRGWVKKKGVNNEVQ